MTVLFVDFTVYNASGEILRTGSCPEGMLGYQAKASDGENLVIGKSYIQEDRVIPGQDPVIVAKPLMAVSYTGLQISNNDIDNLTFSNIPGGAILTITPENGSSAAASATTINDGSARIFSKVKGKFGVVISHPSYKNYTQQVTVI